jgi:hypothetical protein
VNLAHLKFYIKRRTGDVLTIAGPNPGLHATALADQDGQRWIQRFQVSIVPLDIIPVTHTNVFSQKTIIKWTALCFC